MRLFRESFRIVGWLFGRRGVEARLAEEIRFHLEQQIDAYVRAGLSPGDARHRALIEFGGVEAAKELTRDEFRLLSLEAIARDVRLGIRSLRRAPAFTAVATVTLALGIGSATAAFSVINGVLLKPLPYPHSEALVAVWHTAPGANIVGPIDTSAAQYFTYRDSTRTFEAFGLWNRETVTLAGAAGPEQLQAILVTHGTLDALGVPPAVGRWFTIQDDTPGATATVVLTHAYWERRFSADRSIVGRAITINAQARTVIGVMPKGFRVVTEHPDVLLPFQFNRATLSLGQFNYRSLARLKRGISLEDANADVARMLPILLASWPPPRGATRQALESFRLTPALRPLKDEVVGNAGQVLWIVTATVGMVLLMACANVATLVLIRTQGRQSELAVRLTLGAGRGEVARGVLVEHLVLAVAAGVLGIGLAFATRSIFLALAPDNLPRLDEVTIDPAVVGSALLAAVMSGVGLGLLPLKYAGARLPALTQASRRTTTDAPQVLRVRGLLVTAQVALALVLLVGSGLMIRTFAAMRAVEPGFTDPDRLQLVRLALAPAQVPESERVLQLEAEIRDRMAALAGVSAASFANAAPLEPSGGDAVFAEDHAYAAGQLPPVRRFKFVAPGYFSAAGTRLIAGRDLTWADLYDRRPVALVSENMAREMWRSVPAAIGKRIRENSANPWREVVGVVADVHDDGVHLPARAIVYWPALVDHFGRSGGVFAPRVATFLLRSARSGSPDFIDEIRRAVWAVHPGVPVAQVRTLGSLYQASMARTSFTLVMLGLAAATSLALGGIGIYGAIAFAAAQRRREVGVRMALGAQHKDIRRAFVRQGMTLAASGVGCGLLAAAGLTRFMESLLFGISPLDAMTFLAVAVIICATAAVASYIPARRAALADPMDALRAD